MNCFEINRNVVDVASSVTNCRLCCKILLALRNIYALVVQSTHYFSTSYDCPNYIFYTSIVSTFNRKTMAICFFVRSSFQFLMLLTFIFTTNTLCLFHTQIVYCIIYARSFFPLSYVILFYCANFKNSIMQLSFKYYL